MQESIDGLFFCYAPRPSVRFLPSFSPPSAGERLIHEKLNAITAVWEDRCFYSNRSQEGRGGHGLAFSAGMPDVQKYVQNGGGIMIRPGLHEITDGLFRVYPYIFHHKHYVIAFHGYLENLSQLLLQQHDYDMYQLSNHSVSHQSDVGTLTSSVVLSLFEELGYGNEVLLLSELQGQYSFVIYDGSKKQVFAARDPNGELPLYYGIDDAGATCVTNSLDHLPPASKSLTWSEVPPGHYIAGRPAKLHQFALTPEQRLARERTESLDFDDGTIHIADE